MIIIAHRGNLNGSDASTSNRPDTVKKALDLGLNVEVDVWKLQENYYLGHDIPTYKCDESFFKNDRLWCHAKNLEALGSLQTKECHCFWHQGDDFTLTSSGYIWTYPDKPTIPRSILCVEGDNIDHLITKNIYGICGDFAFRWEKELKYNTENVNPETLIKSDKI